MASPSASPVHLPPLNVETDGSSSRSNSPDGNCPICLGNVNNKAFTDACFHTFCFVCLLEWSKIRATCPLCKTSFKSIIHNVVSNDIYDQYHLKPVDTGSFGTDGHGRRFRYSTTLTEEHRVELTWRRNRALERRYRRAQQFHLQAASEERRRMIYRAGLWVRHVGSNRFTRFRDISPGFFRGNPATTHRLVPWLRRDLSVLFSGEDHVTFMTQYILSLIPNVHLQTEEFHEHLRPFLYSQTEHFIHELVSFARSPYDMNTYDRISQYDLTAMHQAQQTVSQPLLSFQRSSDYNDVITLSSEDEVIEVPTLRSLLQSDSASSSTSQLACEQVEALDLSGTHNPEPPSSHQYDQDQPGPSGISRSHPIEVKPEHGTGQENVISDDNSDIEIVGFVKPFDERTPECVILLSSSTEEDEERLQSRRVTKEGGKRHQKRKHTLESDCKQRYRESAHDQSRTGECSTKTHRGPHKKKHKHHKHKGEHSKTHHHQHTSEQEEGTYKHRKRSQSSSRSKTSSSFHRTLKSKCKVSNMRTDDYYEDHSRKRSSSSAHTHRSHSRSRSRPRTEMVHQGDTCRRHKVEDGDYRHGSEQRGKSSERDSWKLHWHNKDRDDAHSGSAEQLDYSVSSSRAVAATFRQHNQDNHYEATLSRKHKASDSKDVGDRSKIRRLDDSQSSSLHLTMVISRKKTKNPDAHERSSSSTDVVSIKSCHSHRKKYKKHKRHKRCKTRTDKEKPAHSVPYSYYGNVYGNEDEANDGDESSDSTEEETGLFK